MSAIDPQPMDPARERDRLDGLAPVLEAVTHYTAGVNSASSAEQCDRLYHAALDAMRTLLSGSD